MYSVDFVGSFLMCQSFFGLHRGSKCFHWAIVRSNFHDPTLTTGQRAKVSWCSSRLGEASRETSQDFSTARVQLCSAYYKMCSYVTMWILLMHVHTVLICIYYTDLYMINCQRHIFLSEALCEDVCWGKPAELAVSPGSAKCAAVGGSKRIAEFSHFRWGCEWDMEVSWNRVIPKFIYRWL